MKGKVVRWDGGREGWMEGECRERQAGREQISEKGRHKLVLVWYERRGKVRQKKGRGVWERVKQRQGKVMGGGKVKERKRVSSVDVWVDRCWK